LGGWLPFPLGFAGRFGTVPSAFSFCAITKLSDLSAVTSCSKREERKGGAHNLARQGGERGWWGVGAKIYIIKQKNYITLTATSVCSVEFSMSTPCGAGTTATDDDCAIV